jgi:outer membrane protein assembly factor BamB
MRSGLVFFAALVLVCSGCGRGPVPPDESTGITSTGITSTSSDGEASAPTSQPAPVFDPPRRFASEPIPVGSGQVAVADGVAYSYSDTSLVAIDLATGSKRWALRMPGAFNLITGPMSRGYPPGIVMDADGRSLVVGAYFRAVAGEGTQQDANFTHVVAADLAGDVRWETDIEPASTTPRVMGGFRDDRGAAVVLDADDTVVLDAASGKVRWTGSGVIPAGVDGDTVIGVRAAENENDPWTMVGLRGSDGAQLWTGPVLDGGTGIVYAPPNLTLTGPGRAIVSGLNDKSEHETIVTDTATGKAVASLPMFLYCRFDGRDTAVCYDYAGIGAVSDVVIGVDVVSGQQLWKLPDEATQRTALNVTAVFHGAVYGDATHTAVVLDARTGADLVSDGRWAFTQVFSGYGVVTSDTGESETVAYQAIG